MALCSANLSTGDEQRYKENSDNLLLKAKDQDDELRNEVKSLIRSCKERFFVMTQAFKYVIQNGIAEESSYPYVGAVGQCSTGNIGTPAVTITSYVTVASDNLAALISAVSLQSVSVAFDATIWQSYKTGTITSSSNCRIGLNHGVLFVNNAYWIVKNSWGTSWGQQGLFILDKQLIKVHVESKCFFHIQLSR